MSNTSPIIGGSGMAVLLGVIIFIGIWFTGDSISFLQKIGFAVFGFFLIFPGLLFSRS